MAKNRNYSIKISKSFIVQIAIFFLMFVAVAYATRITETYTFTPLLNVTNINASEWVNATWMNATYYYGNGSFLTGIKGEGNTTAEIISAVNISTYFQFQAINATDLICSDCIGGTEIDESLLAPQASWINTSTEILAIAVERADWTSIDNYPADCSAGEYVYGLGDTLDCRADLSFNATYHSTLGHNTSVEILAIAVERADWTTIDDYPTTCSAGEYVQAIGDTLTCVAEQTGNTSTEILNVVNVTAYYPFKVHNATDLICTDCIGGTEVDESTLTGHSTFNTTYHAQLGHNTTVEIFLTVDNKTFYKLSNTLHWGNLTAHSLDETWSGKLDVKNLTIAADWDIGGYELRAQTLESDVATGTAPFVVASTTQVANLNASFAGGLNCTDCLSGLQIAELTDADISNTLTCSDLVAGSEVVADTEVANDITIASSNWVNSTKGMHLGDNDYFYFGDSDDASIVWNQTHLIITG